MERKGKERTERERQRSVVFRFSPFLLLLSVLSFFFFPRAALAWGCKADDFDGFSLGLRGLHQRANRVEDILNLPVMRPEFMLRPSVNARKCRFQSPLRSGQCVEPFSQVVVGQRESAKTDEGLDNLDIDLNCAVAPQDARKHGDSMFREGQWGGRGMLQRSEPVTICDQFLIFSISQPEHESIREAFKVAFDRLVESFVGNLIKLRQIAINHDPQATNQEYAALKIVSGNQFSAHSYLTAKAAKMFQIFFVTPAIRKPGSRQDWIPAFGRSSTEFGVDTSSRYREVAGMTRGVYD